jgi:phosphohistidine phosphatase
MTVYLVQHGQAELKSVDPSRSLTERGRREVEQVATFAAWLGLDVVQIQHSGKARAEQTAMILEEALSPPGGSVAVSGLAPMDEVRPVAEALMDASEPVMLVGHLPFLSRLAGMLVTRDPDHSLVQFRNAGIVCLVREGGRWLVSWVLTPDMADAR